MQNLDNLLTCAESVTEDAIRALLLQTKDVAVDSPCFRLIEQRGALIANIQNSVSEIEHLSSDFYQRLVTLSRLGETLHRHLDEARTRIVQSLLAGKTQLAYADCLNRVLPSSPSTHVDTI